MLITYWVNDENSLRSLDVPYDSYQHRRKLMLVAEWWRDYFEIFHVVDFLLSFHQVNHRVMCTIFGIDVMCTTNVLILDSRNILGQWLHHFLQTSGLRHWNRPHMAGVLVHLNMFVILMVFDHCQVHQQIVHVRFESWIDVNLEILDEGWKVIQVRRVKPLEKRRKVFSSK